MASTVDPMTEPERAATGQAGTPRRSRRRRRLDALRDAGLLPADHPLFEELERMVAAEVG